MIELKNDSLKFTFSDVHKEANLSIDFQRTLRIPDDGRGYPLPPGLGRFSLKHVDDYSNNIPSKWIDRGGIMLPMYQSEAMWLNFVCKESESRKASYPFAIKVAAGKINAATGEGWSKGLSNSPQNYMVAPEQPWLDGFHTDKDNVRQFVAMNLGSGYTVEEQINGSAEYGGLQIMVFPMKPNVFEKRFPKVKRNVHGMFDIAPMIVNKLCCKVAPSMGLAPGGRMKQKIYKDPFRLEDWDTDNFSRCFVHLTNSLVWQDITGDKPNHPPITAKRYNQYGLPWFDYYDEGTKSIDNSKKLAELKSIAELAKLKGDSPLPENQSVKPNNVVSLIKPTGKNVVREGSF